MLNLVDIRINNASIENIDVLKQQIQDSFKYLDDLKLTQNDNFEVICNNLKISSDIEDSCKKSIERILNKTGDINEIVTSLKKMQEEARFIRLDLEKAKKQFKENKIRNLNAVYFDMLIAKSQEFSSMLPKCNIEEEIRKFYSNFVLINFKGVREQDLDIKHSFNLSEINTYLSNLEFKIKAFNQSPFINNFIPISIKFINNDLIIEFNNNQYSSLDYDKVKAEYDVLIKIQQEQDQLIIAEEEDKEVINTINTIDSGNNNLSQPHQEQDKTQLVDKTQLLLKVRNAVRNKASDITESDITNMGAGKLLISITITKEELV